MSRALLSLRTVLPQPGYKVGGGDKVRFSLVGQNSKPFPKRFDFRMFSTVNIDPKAPPSKLLDKAQFKPIPKFTSPFLNYAFGLFGSAPLSKHQKGRLYALEHLQQNYKAKASADFKVGDIVGRTLEKFVGTLPVGKNMLSGNIGEHYAHEADTLLQQKATPHSLAMLALVETNHWANTAHIPSQLLGRAMNARGRFRVLVNGMRLASEGKPLTMGGLMKPLSEKDKAAFEQMRKDFKALPAELFKDGKLKFNEASNLLQAKIKDADSVVT